MEAFFGRPSWLVSDLRPLLFLSVKKSPSFLLSVFAGGGQGAELAGATSWTVIDSSSGFFLHEAHSKSISFASIVKEEGKSRKHNLQGERQKDSTHNTSAGSTFFVKNSSTPSSTLPMNSRPSFSLSIIVS